MSSGSRQDIPSSRSTRALIDLDAIAGNLRAFREGVSAETRIMAVVKANGYGHGAVMVAQTALLHGANELAVATVDEGCRLRAAGIDSPILILGPIHPSEIPSALRADLTLAVGDREIVSILSATVPPGTPPVSVHLKVDTGMRRFGSSVDGAAAIAAHIAKSPGLHLAGTFSHFAAADEHDETATLQQQAAFDDALANIRAADIDPGTRHIANSAATLRSRRYDYDLVRIGISLYGIPPSADVELWSGMRQALTLHSRVHRVFAVAPGEGVSYGATYRATGHERAALIPIGYADGYHRILSNQSWMEIASTRAPVRGRVCMDQTVVGLQSDLSVTLGDDVVVIGDGRGEAPSLVDIAEMAQTIPYEIVTSIAARVPRHYIHSGRVVAVEDLHGLHSCHQPDSETQTS